MKKLFYTDSYLSEWESEIVQTIKKEDKYYVVLSETAFYPLSGGQPYDTGEINGIPVIDVIERNGVIYHVLTFSPSNNKVLCKINFDRRFDFMKQHTGQHLFSAILYNKYKYESTSFKIDDEFVSVSINSNDLEASIIREVENISNEYIFKNLNVITHKVTLNEINRFPVTKIPKTNGPIRIVEIENTDFCPCCGTHIKRTGEISFIKVIKIEKSKNSIWKRSKWPC